MQLPASLQTGRVEARFVIDIVDGPDPDSEPEVIAAKGDVLFTASVPFWPAGGPEMLIVKAEKVGQIDDDGYLCVQQQDGTTMQGMRMYATDDPDYGVTGWTWTATPRLVSPEGVKLLDAIAPITFALPTDGVVNLSRVATPPNVPPIGIVQSEANAARAAAAADRAELAVSGIRNQIADMQEQIDGIETSAGTPGKAATVTVAGTTTLAAGSQATVTQGGTETDRTLTFGIPAGPAGQAGSPGTAASVTVAGTNTLAAGSNATVTQGGTATARTLTFGIPAGPAGAAGAAATVSVGTVTTGAAGSAAAVANAGTDAARVLNFTIPRGADGSPGKDGAMSAALNIKGVIPDAASLPASGAPAAATTASKAFTASTASFPNPERGWFQYSETHWTTAAGAGHVPLVQADLVAARTSAINENGNTVSNRSLVFRYFVMEYMRNVDTIPAALLNAIAADFATARAAGCKLIIRFTYSTDGTTGANTDGPGPYNSDTTVARTISHVNQLKATVDAGSDVVAAVQAGFIGTWGEWYYTDNWGNKGTLTTQNWTDRASLITALLGWDSKIAILLRYPGLKHRYMQGSNLPANAANRLGFHNDAFLADDSGDDWGTYNTLSNGQTAAQLKAYLAAETARPVFMMGETAGVSTRNAYANASSELDTYNWSSLNPRYHPDVLSQWTQAQRDEVGNKLGYRLRIGTATLPATGAAGATVAVSIPIINEGWAAPVLARPIRLVFKNGAAEVIHTFTQTTRDLAGGATTTLTGNVTLPTTPGTWTMSLSMPDPVLNARSEFAIRLANGNTTYNGVLNELGSSVVVSAAGTNVAGDAYIVTAGQTVHVWTGSGWQNAGTVASMLPGAVAPVNTPFTVRYVGTAWEYTTLAAAVSAGLNPAQTVWFIGGTTPPAWARSGDLYTQF